MSKNDTSAGLPPIPDLVDGPHNEVYLTYRDLGHRYRRCRRTIVRWVEAGALPEPELIGPASKGFRLSKILEKESATKRAAAVTSCDDLVFVSTTLSLTLGKDLDDDFIYDDGAQV